MQKNSSGRIRLFQLFGITVYLHWSWFILAVWGISNSSVSGRFGSIAWETAAYLLLFTIVLLHEFGHSLACRSVGGLADQITLWPLGGVAYVQPPPRPGALLWSIAAGPLVNVVLLVISIPLFALYWDDGSSFGRFVINGFCIPNAVLLVFNLLPVYPLDGGQLVRALLWFVIGQANSLLVSAWIGLVAAGAGAIAALYFGQWWLAAVAAFAVMQSWTAISRARQLRTALNIPRYSGAACPACGSAPPVGPFWQCQCGKAFDMFQTGAICPNCGRIHQAIACPACGNNIPVASWSVPAAPVVQPQ